MILDGRNRARALTSLARGAAVVDLPGSMDPVTYVLSNNVARRQLSTSQSAMIAARLVTTRQGVPVVTGDVTQEQAAARMSVSVRYVRDAQWLVERHPAIADQVFAGSLSLAAAMRQARPAPMPAAPTNPVAPAEVAAPVEAVPADADALLRGILAMEGVDPGEWIHTLPAARRVAVLTMLEDFARRAYDAAEEGGLL